MDAVCVCISILVDDSMLDVRRGSLRARQLALPRTKLTNSPQRPSRKSRLAQISKATISRCFRRLFVAAVMAPEEDNIRGRPSLSLSHMK